MSNFNQKKDKVKDLFNELKATSDVTKQLLICPKLLHSCSDLQMLLDKQTNAQGNFRWQQQIDEIRKKTIQVQTAAQQKIMKQNHKEEVSQSKQFSKMGQKQLSKRIVRTIVFNEVASKEMKVSPEELEEIAIRMEGNLEVMKEIQELIHEQGENIQKIQDNISRAYLNTSQANQELKEAADLQAQTRLRKIRMGFMGVLAAVGYSIIGIPGMIVGLFTGWKA